LACDRAQGHGHEPSISWLRPHRSLLPYRSWLRN
jgi:hypothetical protein